MRPPTNAKSFFRKAVYFSVENRNSLLTVMSFVILLAAIYYLSLTWLFSTWMTDKAYSHGFFIPLISLYIIWLKRDFLPTVKKTPALLSGGSAIFFSLVLFLVGRIGATVQLEAISLLFIIPAIILFTLGWQYLKALALPLFYLQFMVPWLDPVLERIYLPFQLISAEIGTLLLRMIGYPVYHDRIYIHLPNITMEVARACSGIQFLFSVMAIGLALVYLTQKTWLRAAFVLAMGVLVVIISNGARIALAGVMGQNFGAELLHGPGHILRGWFVAQIGYVGIFLINWLVTKRKSQVKTRLYERAINGGSAGISAPDKHFTVRHPAMLLLFSLSFFTGYLYLYATPNPVAIPAPGTLSYRLGSWYGQDNMWINSGDYFPQADKLIARTYSNPRGEKVNILIAYYNAQNANKRLISYFSRPLYNSGDIIATDSTKRPRRIRHAFSEINQKKYETISWFRLPSGDFTTRSAVKINSFRDGLLHRKNNGAFILLAKPSKENNSQNINEDLRNFLSAVDSGIDEYLP